MVLLFGSVERALRSTVNPAERGSGGALSGETPKQLGRVQLCPLPADSVNTIFLRVNNPKQTGFPKAVRDGCETPLRVPETQSAFHPRAQPLPSWSTTVSATVGPHWQRSSARSHA